MAGETAIMQPRGGGGERGIGGRGWGTGELQLGEQEGKWKFGVGGTQV